VDKAASFGAGAIPRRSTSSLDDTLDAVPTMGNRGGVWRFASPAGKAEIAALRAVTPSTLPDSYFAFLGVTNGGEGDLGVEPGWFVPWRAEDVLLNNIEYQLAESAPGLFGFGSNGGGECLAFDLREVGAGRIVMVPFIGMDLQEAIVIAENFDQFALFVGMPMVGGIV
jgi:hypothetical protein